MAAWDPNEVSAYGRCTSTGGVCQGRFNCKRKGVDFECWKGVSPSARGNEITTIYKPYKYVWMKVLG